MAIASRKIVILLQVISVMSLDIWLSQAFQGLGDRFIPLMSFFTWLGYPQAYMIAMAIIYWSIDRQLGLRVAIFLPLVASLNSMMKQAFHAPRPYWVDPGIRAIRVSNGFGMPSGHAQASTVWLYAALHIKKTGFWIIAIVFAVMIGLSRVYLGVHFSTQVLTGWLTGIVFLFLFARYESTFLSWFLGRAYSVQLLLIGATSLGILLLGALILYLTRSWEIPVEWIINATDDLAAGGESILTSRGLGAVAGNSGGFLGVALGALFAHRRGGFDPGRPWIRVLRSVTGLVLLAALYLLFTLISPDPGKEVLAALWQFGGFSVIALFVIYLFPLLFDKCRRSS